VLPREKIKQAIRTARLRLARGHSTDGLDRKIRHFYQYKLNSWLRGTN
jgi:hypothetical protein